MRAWWFVCSSDSQKCLVWQGKSIYTWVLDRNSAVHTFRTRCRARRILSRRREQRDGKIIGAEDKRKKNFVCVTRRRSQLLPYRPVGFVTGKNRFPELIKFLSPGSTKKYASGPSTSSSLKTRGASRKTKMVQSGDFPFSERLP